MPKVRLFNLKMAASLESVVPKNTVRIRIQERSHASRVQEQTTFGTPKLANQLISKKRYIVEQCFGTIKRLFRIGQLHCLYPHKAAVNDFTSSSESFRIDLIVS